MSMMLRPVRKQLIDEVGTEIFNTEELKGEIMKSNENCRNKITGKVPRRKAFEKHKVINCRSKQGNKLVCGSMDVSALFPSIMKGPAGLKYTNPL